MSDPLPFSWRPRVPVVGPCVIELTLRRPGSGVEICKMRISAEDVAAICIKVERPEGLHPTVLGCEWMEE